MPEEKTERPAPLASAHVGAYERSKVNTEEKAPVVYTPRPVPRSERFAWVVAGLAMMSPWAVTGAQYQLWAYEQNQGSPAVRITPHGYAYHRLDHYDEPQWNSSVVSLFTASYEQGRSACKVCDPVEPEQQYKGEPALLGQWAWWIALVGGFLAWWKWSANDGAGPGGSCSVHGVR